MLRSLAMFLRWKNAVFVTWEILFSKDKLLSNTTPRFLTVEEVTGHPSSCKLSYLNLIGENYWSSNLVHF